MTRASKWISGTTVFLGLAILVACLRTANAQTFDVSSIRPQPDGERGFFVRPPANGRFTAVGINAKLLLMLAYDVQESQIVGGPNWLETAKWNIEARTDDGAQHSTADTKRMLQNLLVARFALRLHHETAQHAVYALTIAKSGVKLKESVAERTNVRVTGKAIDIQHGTLAALTPALASALGRPVVDRTGLSGVYDFTLEWDDAPVQDLGTFRLDTPSTPARDRGSIFTAIQEQLGLRLDSVRAPIDVIVIESLDTPSPN